MQYYKAKIRSELEKKIYLKLSQIGVAPEIFSSSRENFSVRYIPLCLSDILREERQKYLNRSQDNFSTERLKVLHSKIQDKIKLMHDHNILHSDLHVDNILIDDQDEPYIIDFEHSEIIPPGKYDQMK